MGNGSIWDGSLMIWKNLRTYNITKYPTKATLWYLAEKYSRLLAKLDMCLRCPVPYAKRLAILLHWLSHSMPFSQVATLYAVAKSTATSIVHEGNDVLHQTLVAESIQFPTRPVLDQVICDLKTLCGLP